MLSSHLIILLRPLVPSLAPALLLPASHAIICTPTVEGLGSPVAAAADDSR